MYYLILECNQCHLSILETIFSTDEIPPQVQEQVKLAIEKHHRNCIMEHAQRIKERLALIKYRFSEEYHHD